MNNQQDRTHPSGRVTVSDMIINCEGKERGIKGTYIGSVCERAYADY